MGSMQWKQLLLNALESNSHLKHSSYMQLVCASSSSSSSSIFIFILILFCNFGIRRFLCVSGNCRNQRKTFQSHRRFQVLFFFCLSCSSHNHSFVLWKLTNWNCFGFSEDSKTTLITFKLTPIPALARSFFFNQVSYHWNQMLEIKTLFS